MNNEQATEERPLKEAAQTAGVSYKAALTKIHSGKIVHRLEPYGKKTRFFASVAAVAAAFPAMANRVDGQANAPATPTESTSQSDQIGDLPQEAAKKIESPDEAPRIGSESVVKSVGDKSIKRNCSARQLRSVKKALRPLSSADLMILTKFICRRFIHLGAKEKSGS